MTINLKDYDIDPARGFIPSEDPLTALPKAFAVWDKVAAELPLLTMAGRTLAVLRHVPLLDASQLKNKAEQQRALLLLAGFANAYAAVGGGNSLPENIAVPLIYVANVLKRPPITTHGTIVLGNWQRLDKTKPLSLENVDTLLSFRGSIDEKWFFLATLGVELAGAPIIPWLLKAIEAHDEAGLAYALNQITAIIDEITTAFMRVMESCDPHIFYHHVRPYLAGWSGDGMVYEGTGLPAMKLNGGSAGQSSLLQSIDATLGITHNHAHSHDIIQDMRKYMPPKHRAFIEICEKTSRVRELATGKALDAYNQAVGAMDSLRRKHIGLVSTFISKQMPKDAISVGTGGTSFNDFLRQTRIETVSAKIEPLYRGFSKAELDKAYSPSSMVASKDPFLAQYAYESAVSRAQNPPLVLYYGKSSEQAIDLFKGCEPNAPLLLFIHGGYWQALNKSDASFPARELNEDGFHYAALNYTLAPHATMDAIVEEVRASLTYLHNNREALGISKIVIAGHSAGGHLAAMMLTKDLSFIEGAILIGGVYDLTPIRQSYVNDAVKMDEAEALRNSPLFLKRLNDCPLVVTYAEFDTDEFKRQSHELLLKWSPQNSVIYQQKAFNHFDCLFDWHDKTSRLYQDTVRLLKGEAF